MTDTAPNSRDQKRVSAVPYALFVPVLVVMAQSAWAIQRGDSGLNTLLQGVFEPVALFGMAITALISFFIIRPFASRVSSRWFSFLACVLGFTILIELLMPKLAA